VCLAVTAPLIVGAAVVADAHREYVYARLLDHPAAAVALVAPILALAVGLALPRPALRGTVYVIAAMVTLTACALGVANGLLARAVGASPTERGVVAATDAFQLVAYHKPVFLGSDRVVLRLRSRAGLLSREGSDIACFAAPGAGVDPASLFGEASFDGHDQVRVATADGATWWLTFDERSLNVARPLDHCAAASPPPS
jgi:hypothetical protein